MTNIDTVMSLSSLLNVLNFLPEGLNQGFWIFSCKLILTQKDVNCTQKLVATHPNWFVWVKNVVGSNLLGVENFWKQIVGGQNLGVLKWNQVSIKQEEPTIYGGCAQTLPFYLIKMEEFIFQCYFKLSLSNFEYWLTLLLTPILIYK